MNMSSEEKEYKPGDFVLWNTEKRRCGFIISCKYCKDDYYTRLYNKPYDSQAEIQYWFRGRRISYLFYFSTLKLIMRKII